MTTYIATLFDCPVSDADKREAVAKFCAALEASLGREAVAPTYIAYQHAFDAFGELPLPADATEAQRADVAKWIEAESAGCHAAFGGWHQWPGGAHFEIEINSDCR